MHPPKRNGRKKEQVFYIYKKEKKKGILIFYPSMHLGSVLQSIIFLFLIRIDTFIMYEKYLKLYKSF